jgi:chloramphenicol 3-O-phosphotransferase
MTEVRFIAITGPAAAGKSTIAQALQTELIRRGELWLLMELDVFARGLPRDWIKWGKHRGQFAERGFVYARGPDGRVDLTLGSDGRSMLAAFHRSVAAVVKSGVNVICETIVYDEADWQDWLAALTNISARWVKLDASIDVLEGREVERPRPAQGLARGMTARKPVGEYDLEADTGVDATSTIVGRIVDILA